MIDDTMNRWGRIDIIVANAGILRDKSFHKMDIQDFDVVMDVHLMGSVKPIRAAWEIMREQQYGRIMVTTSSTGLYGNFGQANYGAAKLGLVGLMNTLKIEGAKYNIRVNALCPVAATRMTEGLMPQEVLDMLKPEYVSPGMINLVKEDAPTGVILSAAAGAFAAARIEEAKGAFVGTGSALSAEAVAAKWSDITDFSDGKAFEAGSGHSQHLFGVIQKAKS